MLIRKLNEQEITPEELKISKNLQTAKDKYQFADNLLKQWLLDQGSKLVQLTQKLEQQKTQFDNQARIERLIAPQKEWSSIENPSIKESILNISKTLNDLCLFICSDQSIKITQEDLENSARAFKDAVLAIASVVKLIEKTANEFKTNKLSIMEIDRLSQILKNTHEFLKSPTEENTQKYLKLAAVNGDLSKYGLPKAMNSVCKKNSMSYYNSVNILFPDLNANREKETETLNPISENFNQHSPRRLK